MDGEEAAGTGETQSLHDLINDIACIAGAGGFKDPFRKECTDLSRRISLLSYLIDEINVLNGDFGSVELSSSSSSCAASSSLSNLLAALRDARSLLLVARSFDFEEDGATKKMAFQFQCVTWKLEKALGGLHYDKIGVSEEIQEQVELVRAQMKRAIPRFGPSNSGILSEASSHPLYEELDLLQLETEMNESLHINGSTKTAHDTEVLPSTGNAVTKRETSSSCQTEEDSKKTDAVSVPEDFLCPISLEIMRDPVIVATGQTYERSYIQRWIDSGNQTCPKTQQKLTNFTLTPNYVLRSLISEWCVKNNVEQPTALVNGRIKNSDGTFRDVSGDIEAIQALIRNLTSRSVEECKEAVKEIRFLSKRNTDNRILIAEAGAIPILVNLIASSDPQIQENAVTSILNLSIYESNKELIMLAGATPSIIQVLRNGSTEARENAAATLFSLSLADENKIIIGASGAIPALVELLQGGSLRGRKDAATALFNLCIYQGNKGRAVRAGIIAALLKMLTESDGSMVDEALTILSVLSSHSDAKVAIVKAGTISVLVDLMRTGLPRNKENAAAILLALCKRDVENLRCLSELGAGVMLMEIGKSGTERAKRKATSLLELLRRLQ